MPELELIGKITDKQKKYLSVLLNRIDIEKIMRHIFLRKMLGKDLPDNLSELTKGEASKLIGRLLETETSIATGESSNDSDDSDDTCSYLDPW